ncbi:MAG TPA: Hsp70 family protein [Planctomycetes bacterium]|nr:Hsp70 family protein [Fuerstiella sp.]HIK93810.1 Hsp70 family protein [Planctomycetota bacterium]
MSAKYAIGIDLGTTNCVLAFALLESDTPQVELLPIPQLVAPQTIERRNSLPSFLYVARSGEVESHEFDLPWAENYNFAVGEVARSQSSENPDRTVGTAKSWLCHSRVDRHQPILPWKAPDKVAKISPVMASQRYLEHLVAAWTQTFPDAPIAQQQIVLTVPASFGASARELTREAALMAGLPESLVLLEEPQAATYAWLASSGDDWRKSLTAGDRLLVCDVGGGTTDLTLVAAAEEDGELQLRRQAVGNHLLVGGDNMDLALAYQVSELFREKGTDLDPWQSVSLWHSCRAAKETLLAADGPETQTISVVGRGSRLIGGSVSVEVNREDVARMLVDGFFAKCDITDQPSRQRASGFQEIGLPYEADTAITRHLAAFLQRQTDEGSAEAPAPTHLLFNGGVFKSDRLQQALLDQLADWYGDAAPQILAGAHDLDYAVGRGAAYYAWASQRGGIRIRGGTPRSYYVGIETAGLAIPGAPRPMSALCVVPHGMEEGTEADVPSEEIGLVVGAAARFRIFSSSSRTHDAPGDKLTRWSADELVETDSMEATLETDSDAGDEYVPVRFQSRITELGIFELCCVHTATDERWKLEFSVRDDAEV